MGGRRDGRKEERKGAREGRENGRGDLLQGLRGIDAPGYIHSGEIKIFTIASRIVSHAL